MIDIKELRVGAHIRIGGVRHCVSNIDSLNGQIGIGAFVEGSDGVKHAIGYSIKDVEPIPLTAELLRELGFHEVKDTYFSDWHKEWFKITNNTGQAHSWWTYNGLIRLYALHQLENLYYLTTKQELIKED